MVTIQEFRIAEFVQRGNPSLHRLTLPDTPVDGPNDPRVDNINWRQSPIMPADFVTGWILFSNTAFGCHGYKQFFARSVQAIAASTTAG